MAALKQLPQQQHYVKKTLDQEHLDMAQSFSERKLLGLENVSGWKSRVKQFFSREASNQVKNLFLVGELQDTEIIVESADVGEQWGREDMVLDMSQQRYRDLYLRVATNFKGAVYLVNVKLTTEEEDVWWQSLSDSSTSGTPPISLFFLHSLRSFSIDRLIKFLLCNRCTRNLIFFQSDIEFGYLPARDIPETTLSLDTLHLEDVIVYPEFMTVLKMFSITHSLTLIIRYQRILIDEPEMANCSWCSFDLHQLLDLQIKYLSLSNFIAVPKDLLHFMSCLKVCTNASLYSVSLINLRFFEFRGDQDRSTLVNAVVDALYYSGLPFLLLDFSDPAIEAQLLLNQQRHSNIGLSHLQQLEKVPATAVRLFICGDAYAGKTTLLSSLSSVCSQVETQIHKQKEARYVQGNMQVASAPPKQRQGMNIIRKVVACFTCHASPTVEHIEGVTQASTSERTRGIQVHAIVRDGIQVSAWDMAGQKEFHAFHDLMFPDSNASSPAMFMFVWSPIDTKDQALGNFKTKGVFEASFSYWLKFIASKTRQSSILRKLFVVLTRKDQLEFVKDALAASIDAVAASFGKIIQVVEVVEVDARSPTSAKPLASCIFDAAREALNGVKVYGICNEVSRFFSKRHAHDSSMQYQPIIPWTAFSKICEEKFNVVDSDIQKAIAYSLNESGEVIYLSNISFIVLDPNWFCHEVMGSLIHFPDCSNSKAFFPIHGYANQHHLEKLLQGSTYSDVEGSVLVDLMEAMHLCCKDPDDVDGMVFIPATLTKANQNEGQMHLRWRGATDESFQEYAYLGRRLQCDKKDLTFLTPGLFPLIQTVFRKAFFVSKADVEVSKDIISICMQDMEIMVELGLAEGQHVIDVMVRAPNQGDIGHTLTYVEDEILKTLIRVCAQPVGNQGVKLIEGVIRPDCLRVPAPSHVREDQCVLVVDLKQELRKKLEEGRPQEKLLHLWVGNNYLQPVANRLIDLLGFVKYEEVLIDYESSLKDALLLSHTNAKAGAHPETLSTSSDVDIHGSRGNQYNTPVQNQKRMTEQSHEVSVDESGEEIVLAISKSMVRSLDREMKSMKSRLSSLKASVDAMREDMRSKLDVIHGKVENMRSDVLPKIQKSVEQSLAFSVESEAGKVPRFIFFTSLEDRTMVTAVFKGLTRVHIELFCEHRRIPHRVNGQKGLCITTMDEGAFIKRTLPFVNGFLKLLTLVAKVGAHAIAGAGSSVPDFSKLIALALDTPGFLDNQGLLTNVSTTATADGWQQEFVSVLQKHGGMEESNIYDKFKLRRALYQDTKKVAWLCDTHYKQEQPLPLV